MKTYPHLNVEKKHFKRILMDKLPTEEEINLYLNVEEDIKSADGKIDKNLKK